MSVDFHVVSSKFRTPLQECGHFTQGIFKNGGGFVRNGYMKDMGWQKPEFVVLAEVAQGGKLSRFSKATPLQTFAEFQRLVRTSPQYREIVARDRAAIILKDALDDVLRTCNAYLEHIYVGAQIYHDNKTGTNMLHIEVATKEHVQGVDTVRFRVCIPEAITSEMSIAALF